MLRLTVQSNRNRSTLRIQGLVCCEYLTHEDGHIEVIKSLCDIPCGNIYKSLSDLVKAIESSLFN